MPNDNQNVKPCPFCNENAYNRRTVDDDGHIAWQITCEECGANLEAPSTREVAQKWNRRAPADCVPTEQIVGEVLERELHIHHVFLSPSVIESIVKQIISALWKKG